MNRVTNDLLEEFVFKIFKEVHRLENMDMERFGLSWRDIHSLKFLLKHSPCRVSDLANELNMPLFAVSRLLAAMTEKGLVAKAKDEVDKRNTYLSLTPEGARIIKQVQAHHYHIFTSYLELMNENEASIMISSMGNVGKLLETISTKKRPEKAVPRNEEPGAVEVVF
jgi:DNA-binding MarR family transcriptional regulator